jgi:Protein of unknown function (DUF3307)
MILFVKLVLAHLIGDFILQPLAWVNAKETWKLRAWQLYAHVLLHAVLVIVIVWDSYFWTWALLIAAAHFIIDALKISLQTEKTKRVLFFVDQLLHLIVLFVIACLYQDYIPELSVLRDPVMLLFITCIVFLTTPTSSAIRFFIARWTPYMTEGESESLQSAGKYIGILERLFVFVFFASGHPEGVGFLIAAKSVFRFGDLKEAKSRKLTEYVLIGTLISFGIAMLTGILFERLIL